jgi:hypothetical protein
MTHTHTDTHTHTHKRGTDATNRVFAELADHGHCGDVVVVYGEIADPAVEDGMIVCPLRAPGHVNGTATIRS